MAVMTDPTQQRQVMTSAPALTGLTGGTSAMRGGMSSGMNSGKDMSLNSSVTSASPYMTPTSGYSTTGTAMGGRTMPKASRPLPAAQEGINPYTGTTTNYGSQGEHLFFDDTGVDIFGDDGAGANEDTVTGGDGTVYADEEGMYYYDENGGKVYTYGVLSNNWMGSDMVSEGGGGDGGGSMATGGFTGKTPPGMPPQPVRTQLHTGEFVLPPEIVKMYGTDALEYLRRGLIPPQIFRALVLKVAMMQRQPQRPQQPPMGVHRPPMPQRPPQQGQRPQNGPSAGMRGMDMGMNQPPMQQPQQGMGGQMPMGQMPPPPPGMPLGGTPGNGPVGGPALQGMMPQQGQLQGLR